jgi:hypothetical protein
MPFEKPQHTGTLTPAIEALVFEFVTELGSSKDYSPEEYLSYLDCPVVKAPIAVITLLGLSYFGDYVHPDEKIQAFIRSNFEGMKGSIRTTVAQLMSAIYMGNAVAEWGVIPKGKQWVLDRIKVLTPGRWHFRGSKGEIEAIRYTSQQIIDVPYAQVLHIVNNPHLAFDDPRGVSDMDAAIPGIKAWRILMAETIVAGQRKATPLTAGFYDPDSPNTLLYEADGTPRINPATGDQLTQSPGEEMSEQLSNLENKSVLVTSLRNRIDAIANNADVNFFTEALRVCHKIIFLSFLFPETGLEVVGSGGSGDSNLNKGHMALLRLNIQQIVGQIKEEMLEKMVRPLIVWNFGEQDRWGDFIPQPGQEEMRVEIGNLLISALANQIFSIDELKYINKLEELMGISISTDLPKPEAGQTGSGFGLNDLNAQYWRMFETNGAAQK